MKKIFYISFLKRLNIREYVFVYKFLVDKSNELSSDIESEDFTKILALMNSHIPLLDRVAMKERTNKLTTSIASLHEDRVKAYSGFKNIVKGHVNSMDADIKNHALVLQEWITSYAPLMNTRKQLIVTSCLEELSIVLTSNVKIGAAVVALRIADVLNCIVKCNEEYIKLWRQRNELISSYKIDKIDNKEVIKTTSKDLELLINNLALQYTTKPSSCEELVMEFATMSSKIRADVLRTKTLRKKKKDENNNLGNGGNVDKDNENNLSLKTIEYASKSPSNANDDFAKEIMTKARAASEKAGKAVSQDLKGDTAADSKSESSSSDEVSKAI